MTRVNLDGEVEVLRGGLDSVVIRKYIAGIAGGRTLDTGDYPLPTIRAGHVIIRSKETGDYKPMPVVTTNGKADGYKYDKLPADCEYAGVLVSSVPTKDARAAIMYAGEVNDKATPFSIDAVYADSKSVEEVQTSGSFCKTASIREDLKAALPMLAFMHD